MSATFTEALPATKSSPISTVRFTPAEGNAFSHIAGVMTIDTKRARVSYVVSEFPADFAGRAFVLVKTTEGTDATEERYACFVGDQGERICECKGYHYAGKCKHLAALEALIANAWL